MDYHTVVNKAADLSTVKGHLETYTTLADFAGEIRLIFHNAQAYVPVPTLLVHQAANVLLVAFEELIPKVRTWIRLTTTRHKEKLQSSSITHCKELARFPPPLTISCSYAATVSNWITRASMQKKRLGQSSGSDCDGTHYPRGTRASGLLDILWRTSRLESLARRDAAARGAEEHKARLYDNATELERHHEVIKIREADLREQRERDEARQRARKVARRQRDELEQTVDFDQQRLAVSSFLEQAGRGQSTQQGFD